MLLAGLVRVADHSEHAARLAYTVDGEVGVEYLVAAVLAVGLGEHHEFNIRRIAPKLCEGGQQIVNLVIGQRQTELHIGMLQRLSAQFGAAAEHIHVLHRRRMQFGEQATGLGALEHHTLGHAVVQQRGDPCQLGWRQ